jgi:N-acetylglutamate synthase-like GNAT family acetyltransferase
VEIEGTSLVICHWSLGFDVGEILVAAVDVEEIVDLRYRVLRAGLPRDAAYFPGDRDATTVHLAAKSDGKIIGCATVLVNEWDGQRACQLRGMAIDPDWQGKRIGRRLLDEIHQTARGAGVQILWANARVPAAEFYRKHGWEIVSEEFEIPTAGPHYKMIRRLEEKI